LCKTDELEPDVAVDESNETNETRSPKSSDDEKFYTLEELMKGERSEGGLVDSLLSPLSRRLPNSNCAESNPPPATLNALPAHTSTLFRVVQLSFPQLQLYQSDDQQIETSCTQAIMQGDRPRVLRQLLKLWQEGHERVW